MPKAAVVQWDSCHIQHVAQATEDTARIVRTATDRTACLDIIVLCADAAAAAAVVPAETAALPGGSAAQREVFKKSQQKQREAAVWCQTAGCICANYALYWRREGAEFPVAPTAGLT